MFIGMRTIHEVIGLILPLYLPPQFENDSCACFMRISRVICQCATSSPVTLQFDYGEDSVLIAVPLCAKQ